MRTIPSGFARAIGSILPPIITGLSYYAAARTALYFTQGEDGIATLWPASGILIAVLLAVSDQKMNLHLVAAAIASLAANLGTGNGWSLAIGFTIANIAEAVVAIWLLRFRGGGGMSLMNLNELLGFSVAAAIGVLCSASIATLANPTPTFIFWFSWFSTALLGILIVTPILLIIGSAFSRNELNFDLPRVIRGITPLALVTGTSLITFLQASYPMLFMPMLAVLWATFRLGPGGAAGGVLIVAIISSIASGLETGPQTLAKGGPLLQNLFIQFYLLMLFAAAFPIAALLSARDRLLENLSEKSRLLEMAEGTVNVGHWRLDLATQALTWSQEVYRIHGLENELPPPLDRAIKAYHPKDRKVVAQCIEHAISKQVGFEFCARIVRPSGEIRHVRSKGEIDQVGDEGPIGLFGIIQDISAQIAREREIEMARADAEKAAREATILADIDQLTEIANRRRSLVALDQAVQAAAEKSQSLSVAIFDIDHFKRINDTFGHQTGDEVLTRVAKRAADQLNSIHTVGRLGGEEFVVILPEENANSAMLLGERIRSAIEANSDEPRVTISMGIAELHLGENAQSALGRADKALYLAKHEGRNTLRLAT